MGDRYLVREIFGPTIQGEGYHAGRACVFLRFGACNLACSWCDTDFAAERSRELGAAEIRDQLLALDRAGSRLVIVTGGEPALQWDQPLADILADAGFRVHMESNGTRALAAPVDWLTVSPKPQFHDGRFQLAPEVAPAEVKVIVDDSVTEAQLASYRQRYRAEHWFLQPCMDERYDHHLARALALVGAHPDWRLSLQIHRLVGVP